jgi:hypothetical protein
MNKAAKIGLTTLDAFRTLKRRGTASRRLDGAGNNFENAPKISVLC